MGQERKTGLKGGSERQAGKERGKLDELRIVTVEAGTAARVVGGHCVLPTGVENESKRDSRNSFLIFPFRHLTLGQRCRW